MSVIGRGVRNAFRNGIRMFAIVVILGLSIAMALAMLLARQAVQDRIGSVEASIGNTITVAPAGFRGFQGGGEPLTTAALDKVAATPHVVGLTMTLQDRLAAEDTTLLSSLELGSLGRRFAGGGADGSGGVGAGGAGVDGGPLPLPGAGQVGTGAFTPPVIVLGTTDPSTLQAAGGGEATLTSGSVFGPTSDDDVALLGESLATKNSLVVGSTFTAHGTTMTVSGIFTSGNAFGDSTLVMPLRTLQRLSGQPDAITAATVRVDSITNLDATEAALKASLGDSADVVSQQDTSVQAMEPLNSIKSVSSFSLTGAVVAGSVIILLTMLMIVRERRREIAVLKAIGAPNRKVISQFVYEAITFTSLALVVGVVGGIVAGNPVTRLLVNTNDGGTAVPGGPGTGGGGAAGLRQAGGALARFANPANGLVNLSTLRASVGWNVLLYGLAAALVITIVGSAVPAYLIARIRPAEVLRGD